MTWSPESVHLQHQLPRPGGVGWQQVGRMLDGEAFRFTFVRDPVRRAESAYLDKIVRQPLLRCGVQRVLGQPEDPDAIPTFDEYVDALEQSDPLTMDPHWRPQHLNLMHPLVSYDLIGRLETFDADMARLRDATGMPAVPLEDVN